jgi:enoyl-CoA hydratase/carnithine racemase
MVQGVRLVMQNLVEMEKPVIAKVNGDAVGFGQSIMFACDLIVARADARIFDHHLSLHQESDGRRSPYGKAFSVAPGDGGGTFVPMHLPPALAMEYLLLGRELTAAQLAEWGVINYAVPPEELDATVDGLVQRILDRSAYAVAFTKRLVRRPAAAQMNLTMDASIAYEWINFLHFQGTGRDHHSLRYDSPPEPPRPWEGVPNAG